MISRFRFTYEPDWRTAPMSFWVHVPSATVEGEFEPAAPPKVPRLGYCFLHFEFGEHELVFSSPAQLQHLIDVLSRKPLPTSRQLSAVRGTSVGPNGHWLSRLPTLGAELGYAYCPRCQRAIRFKASAEGGPPWLKEVASSLGRGEPAVLYCISCWLVPEVGDFIAVLDPPYGATGIEQGTVGRVVETEGQGPFRKRFLVEFTGESGSSRVQHLFYAHQIQAAGVELGSTIQVSLLSPGEKTNE